MAPLFDRALRELLRASGCALVRQGKGRHEIWKGPIAGEIFPCRSDTEPSYSERRSAAGGVAEGLLIEKADAAMSLPGLGSSVCEAGKKARRRP